MSGSRWSTWDLAEAFHLACAADYLAATDLLGDTERTPEQVAVQAALEPSLVAGMLNLLADRTDLVVRGDQGFKRGPGLDIHGRAVLDQYVGAYGPNARSLSAILADADVGREVVDRRRHAQAFSLSPGPGEALLPNILRRLELHAVLDLGCGTGGLLIEMGCCDPSFRGTGIDANPDMIHIAEQRRHSHGIDSDAIEFIVADVAELQTAIPAGVAQRTETVVAASLLNEFFHPDPQRAVVWLQQLRTMLPHAILVVADYYGVLGNQQNPPPRRALHDWIQLISGQGVPPPTLAYWEGLYREAGCAVVHAIEDRVAGVFIHFVRLAGV